MSWAMILWCEICEYILKRHRNSTHYKVSPCLRNRCTGDHDQEIISREMYGWSCLTLSSVLNLNSYFFFFWDASSPLCWFNYKKRFCALHVQSNTTIFHLAVQQVYNYMFQPYMLAIFRLWFNLQISYTRCVGCSFRLLGVGWGNNILFQ